MSLRAFKGDSFLAYSKVVGFLLRCVTSWGLGTYESIGCLPFVRLNPSKRGRFCLCLAIAYGVGMRTNGKGAPDERCAPCVNPWFRSRGKPLPKIRAPICGMPLLRLRTVHQ